MSCSNERVVVCINNECKEVRLKKLVEFAISQDCTTQRQVYMEEDRRVPPKFGCLGYTERINVSKLGISALVMINNDEDLEFCWKNVTELRRQPIYNKLLKITTKSGNSISVHSGAVLCVNSFDETKFAYKLCVGDHIPAISSFEVDVVNKVHINKTAVQLDWAFGKFIGLFLTKGSIDSTNGICVIDMCETDALALRKFTHSKIITQFVKKHCGTKAHHKHIPSFAYNANSSFVKGLMNAFGQDIITPSERLVEGVTFLCARIGWSTKKTTFKRGDLVCHALSIEHQIMPNFKFEEIVQIDEIAHDKNDFVYGIQTDNSGSIFGLLNGMLICSGISSQ